MKVFLLSLLFSTQAIPIESVQNVFEKLQSDYKTVETIQAGFKQTIRKRRFGEEHFVGKLVAKKPNQLKCEYDDPKGKLIVSDGKKMTLYDPEDQQALISNVTGELPPPFVFLWGNSKWKDDFDLAFSKTEKSTDPSIQIVELTPKKEYSGVSKVLLWIRKEEKKSVVFKSRVSFVYGEENELEFFDPKWNEKIGDDKFVIHLPKNVAEIKTPTVR